MGAVSGIRNKALPACVVVVAIALLCAGHTGCRGRSKAPSEAPATAKREPLRQPLEGGPAPTLLMTQAQFDAVTGPDGKTRQVPGPAKLVLVRKQGDTWSQSIVEDPDSNVFHKAMAVDLDGDGVAREILTIGAVGAHLKSWRFEDGAWKETTLLSRTFGGKTDRFRDMEIGDVDADGRPELVIATHDQGVVLVVELSGDKAEAAQIDARPDTFVHEIELGDVDGDGRIEIFATPSHPNRATMESQPGEVVMYRHNPATGGYDKSLVDRIEDTHVKEILAAYLDGSEVATLFSVLEAVTRKQETGTAVVRPVEIRQYTFAGDGTITNTVAARLDDRQCRFLTPGDLDGDGRTEIVAAGMKAGIWLLDPQADGTWAFNLIDSVSSGYEHAALATDLEGDGQIELYVAADDQGELRRYLWNGTMFEREFVVPLAKGDITWNLMPAKL